MKILQLVTQLERAGAQTAAAWIQSVLVEDHDITTRFLYRKSESEMFANDQCLAAERPASVRSFLRLLSLLRTTWRQEEYDRVLAHTHYAIVIAAFVAVTRGRLHSVIAVHHWPVERYPKAARLMFSALNSIGAFAANVYVSEAVAPRRDQVVIPNPVIAVSDESGGADLAVAALPRQIDIVACARHAAEKGLDDLMRAMQSLPDRRLSLIGTGPLTAELRLLASALHVDERVQFVGAIRRQEVRDYLRNCSVLVLPSLWEAMPMVLLEGAEAGADMVVSDIPAHRFLLDRQAAISCRPAAPSSIAEAVLEVASPVVQATLIAGRERIMRDYSPEAISAKWAQLFCALEKPEKAKVQRFSRST